MTQDHCTNYEFQYSKKRLRLTSDPQKKIDKRVIEVWQTGEWTSSLEVGRVMIMSAVSRMGGIAMGIHVYLYLMYPRYVMDCHNNINLGRTKGACTGKGSVHYMIGL